MFQVRQKVPAWCYAVCLCSVYQTMLRSLRGNMPAVQCPVHKAAPWAQRVGQTWRCVGNQDRESGLTLLKTNQVTAQALQALPARRMDDSASQENL